MAMESAKFARPTHNEELRVAWVKAPISENGDHPFKRYGQRQHCKAGTNRQNRKFTQPELIQKGENAVHEGLTLIGAR